MAQLDEWTAPYSIKHDGRADDVTARDWAAEQARQRAKTDAPDATANVVSVKRNRTTYTVQVARTRTAARKGRKENSDMATKAPVTDAPAPAAPYVIPAPGTGRITEELQLALQAKGLRRCVGMPKIGHPQHDTAIDNFNLNASRLLGRARLCKDARKQYNAVLAAAKADTAPAKASKAKAPKPEAIKTAKPRAAKAPAPAATAAAATTAEATAPVADEAQPTAGTKAAAAAAARAQVRREAQAAAAAKRAARTKAAAAPAPSAEPVVAAAEAADDLPF